MNVPLAVQFLLPGGYQSSITSEELSYARNKDNLVSACSSARSIFTEALHQGLKVGQWVYRSAEHIGHF